MNWDSYGYDEYDTQEPFDVVRADGQIIGTYGGVPVRLSVSDAINEVINEAALLFAPPCGCRECTQFNNLAGGNLFMDRDQVAQVAEAIGSSLMPDNALWTNRFTIESTSSSRTYTVAQRRSDGVWGCSCPSWINRRHCKHLTDILGRLAELQVSAATDSAVLAMLESARTAFLDLDSTPVAVPTVRYSRPLDL